MKNNDFWRKEAWDALNEKVDRIEEKVDTIKERQDKMIGQASIISLVVGASASLVAVWIKGLFGR